MILLETSGENFTKTFSNQKIEKYIIIDFDHALLCGQIGVLSKLVSY